MAQPDYGSRVVSRWVVGLGIMVSEKTEMQGAVDGAHYTPRLDRCAESAWVQAEGRFHLVLARVAVQAVYASVGQVFVSASRQSAWH